MFDFPKQAELNRLLPRSKVYGFAKPSRAVRDRFVRQIGEIVWDEVTRRLVEFYRPVRIYLFGSAARGESVSGP
jgi:hypothetical protein